MFHVQQQVDTSGMLADSMMSLSLKLGLCPPATNSCEVDKNTVLSPLSIASILTILMAGKVLPSFTDFCFAQSAIGSHRVARHFFCFFFTWNAGSIAFSSSSPIADWVLSGFLS